MSLPRVAPRVTARPRRLRSDGVRFAHKSRLPPCAGARRWFGSPCGQTRAQPATQPDGTLASRVTRWTLRSSLPRGALAQATRPGPNARPDGDARVGSAQVAADGGRACACASRTRLRGCGHRVAAALVRVVYASLQVATSLRSLPQVCAALLRLILHWPEEQVVSLWERQLWRSAALLAKSSSCEFHGSARAGNIDRFAPRILPQRVFLTISRPQKLFQQTHNLRFCPQKGDFIRAVLLLNSQLVFLSMQKPLLALHALQTHRCLRGPNRFSRPRCPYHGAYMFKCSERPKGGNRTRRSSKHADVSFVCIVKKSKPGYLTRVWWLQV